MKRLFLLLSFNFLYAQNINLPSEIKQLLVVSVDQATQNHATLHAYERDTRSVDAPWSLVFDAIPVSLGRNGLGVGIGLHDTNFNKASQLPNKIEEDGRSPAGIFRLSKIFGYAANTINSKMPYIPISETLHCVDDSNSEYYNKIVEKKEGYKSFEKMKRKDNLYKWGIIVDHNVNGLKKRGSCIFIHIMNKENPPTAGCTAMREEDLLKVIKWLDKEKQPALLQYLSN